MRRVLFYVTEAEQNDRLGRLLQRRLPAVNRGKITSLLIRGEVKLAGKLQRDSRAPLKVGWSVQLAVPGNLGNSPMSFTLEERSLLYQDQHVFVVEKPHSVKVHRNHPGETVVTMMEATRELAGGEELFLVHRLDRGTSGVLIFARSREAAKNLGRQFARQKVKKSYLALVEGEVPEFSEIDAPLFRSSGRALIDRRRGKECLTRVTRLGCAKYYSLVRCRPTSGRFHQIRAHLAALGHPLAGDLLYGGSLGIRTPREIPPLDLPGAMLHCEAIEFALPDSGKRIEVRTGFPARFRTALKRAGLRPLGGTSGGEVGSEEEASPQEQVSPPVAPLPKETRSRPRRTPVRKPHKPGKRKPGEKTSRRRR
jgi:RluA family pseudouridine synthase